MALYLSLQLVPLYKSLNQKTITHIQHLIITPGKQDSACKNVIFYLFFFPFEEHCIKFRSYNYLNKRKKMASS